MSNIGVINGRIEHVREYKGRYFHDVRLPAVDEFSSPGWARVEAKHRLGSVGEMLQCKVGITGFRRTFETRDGGEGSNVESRFNYLEPAK